MNNLGQQRSIWRVLPYIFPAAAIFLAFTLVPFALVILISFFHWNVLNAAQSYFIGLGNYRSLVTSGQFWHSLAVTLYFVVGSVPVGMAIALGIAMLLMQKFPARAWVRLAVFSPYVTPIVATSIVWIWIFNPQFGLLNAVLHKVGLPELQWLESPTWAMPSIILYTLWHSLGFNVVIFLSGLSSVSQDVIEAARMDGANRWQEFWHVIWPMLTPTTLFVLVISTIGALQAFTQFFTMTGGGPINATTTTSFLLYQMAFVYYHTGFAAALAVVLFAIIAGLTLMQFRLAQRRTFYQ
ncbi:MAG: sugar ABC transporter permease [Firmicutes bacterium]|nr:sugar ABC transporter permease [Bacillota bacterium]